MKATPALLFALAAALGAPLFALGQQPDSMSEAVRNLQASKAFGVTPAGTIPSGPSYPDVDLTGKTSVDTPRFFNYDPTRNDPLIDPPPPEALTTEPKEKKLRRTNPNAAPKTDDNWLVNAVNEQQKQMEEQEKALAEKKGKDKDNDDPLNPGRKTGDKSKTGSNSSPLGNGFYSRYTTSGLNSLQTNPNAGMEPFGTDPFKKSNNSKLGLPADLGGDPIDEPTNVTKVASPIIDPTAMTKMDLNLPANRAQTPNARLDVDGWLKGVKDRERQAMLPKQPASVQDLYAENQIKPPPEVKPTVAPQPLPRPTAQTMKSSLPPNRKIKDPNDF